MTYNVSLVKSVFNSLKWLITGKLGMDAMSGPIGLTTVVGDVVTAKVEIGPRIIALFQMAALISANLAAFNILPIPGLDGGKLVFILIELIRRGKKVPPEKEAVVFFDFPRAADSVFYLCGRKRYSAYYTNLGTENYMYQRTETRTINIGGIPMGGGSRYRYSP